MVHLAGIDKGPVLDWTDDNGLIEHFRKWKKKGGNSVQRSTQCCSVMESSATMSSIGQGETGIELVDKWETEGKIIDANRNNIAGYFELFEEQISPKCNALIMQLWNLRDCSRVP